MYKNKKIIYIYGPSGAGSTTLGTAFVKEHGGKLIDTDTYYLRNDNFQDRYKDMINAIEDSEENLIVITGSFWNWKVDFDNLAKNIDVFVRNELDKDIRIERLIKRESERWGEENIKPGGNHYDAFIHGIEWTSKYETGDLSVRSRATFEYYEKKYNKKPIMIDSINSVEENVKKISL